MHRWCVVLHLVETGGGHPDRVCFLYLEGKIRSLRGPVERRAFFSGFLFAATFIRMTFRWSDSETDGSSNRVESSSEEPAERLSLYGSGGISQQAAAALQADFCSSLHIFA